MAKVIHKRKQINELYENVNRYAFVCTSTRNEAYIQMREQDGRFVRGWSCDRVERARKAMGK